MNECKIQVHDGFIRDFDALHSIQVPSSGINVVWDTQNAHLTDPVALETIALRREKQRTDNIQHDKFLNRQKQRLPARKF